jgi:hypothetical protein
VTAAVTACAKQINEETEHGRKPGKVGLDPGAEPGRHHHGVEQGPDQGAAQRLVTIDVADGEVRLAHPLHGEVIRAAMPRLRARAILLAEAERLETSYPAHGPAALRIAVWRLDAGGRPDPAVLVRGAYLAPGLLT